MVTAREIVEKYAPVGACISEDPNIDKRNLHTFRVCEEGLCVLYYVGSPSRYGQPQVAGYREDKDE